MSIEVILDNKNGNVWNISEIVSGITWKTSRFSGAGSLDFTLIKNAIYQATAFTYQNGDVISVKKDGEKVFYGYIFSIDGGKDEDVKIKAYDQIRYLQANDTYKFTGATASEVIKRIASDFKLKTGSIVDTKHKITMLEDNKKLLDIIYKALDLTIINTGSNYVFYDDFGSLALKNVKDLLVDIYIGEGSLLTDFNVKTSIDSDTYNQIVLYKDNEKTKKREKYVAKDSANIKKWGVLQLYESVDENMNAAQINKYLDALAIIKNRETKEMKIEAIGDIRIRAGSYVRILISEYGINQPFLVDACSHSFDGAEHMMQLELKVI
ncbi:hypothetical protein BVG16_15660 [Paenibacillus selenitireducens]|uniref:YqbQ/XkdQ domain-containing protein n=1 Tax=Paenibacillus selenitireducens TaxID=1324314 RepID=A0A1T2X9N6_9BACL|nr:hypothetical protein [Paenibacillus selenitireducens]OPA76617.1 hypothetical protein BVG16_15660 [Paenibacillus selenitireducens]